MVRKTTLRRFSFLRHLDEDALARLAHHVTESHYPAGHILFTDQQIGDTFYLLKTGRVEIFKPTAQGDVTLNLIRPGDYFGEMSLLDNRPRSASARAVTDATVLEIPKTEFLALVQQFSPLVYQTARLSDERLRERDQSFLTELALHNQQLQQLYDTSLDITRHRELAAALSAIRTRATMLLNSTAGQLYLYDETTRALRAPIGKHLASAATRAFATHEPVIANRARHQRGLAAPIGKSLGVLIVYRPLAADPFTTNDARLLLLFANQAAIAIDNARLFALAAEKARIDGELHTAHQMQRSLLPSRAPRIPGFQLACLWRPAREVAGDFYDFIPIGDGKWGIVIADVCDKGMPAALFMATARSVLRASIHDAPNAVDAMARANRLIAADAPSGMFITLFLGVLDPATRRLEYVNAGHNPPMWLHASGSRIESLKRTGLPLGIDAATTFTARAIEFAPNDLLMLYTDGVTDAVTARNAFFGINRFSALVKSVAHASATTVLDTIDHQLRGFIGACPLADDITLVALRATHR